MLNSSLDAALRRVSTIPQAGSALQQKTGLVPKAFLSSHARNGQPRRPTLFLEFLLRRRIATSDRLKSQEGNPILSMKGLEAVRWRRLPGGRTGLPLGSAFVE